jgi:hypothetical protein
MEIDVCQRIADSRYVLDILLEKPPDLAGIRVVNGGTIGACTEIDFVIFQQDAPASVSLTERHAARSPADRFLHEIGRNPDPISFHLGSRLSIGCQTLFAVDLDSCPFQNLQYGQMDVLYLVL